MAVIEFIIIDSIMGSGKTTWLIKYLNEHPEKKFIVVVLYQEECKRIQKECPALRFQIPNKENVASKTISFHMLLKDHRNIVMCHELLKLQRFTRDEQQLIQDYGYTLVIDEALEVVEPLPYTKQDVRHMLTNGLIGADETTGLVKWVSTEYDGGALYKEPKRQMKRRDVILFDERQMLWLFPIDLLLAFEEVYVLTFLFEGSNMRSYLDIYGIPFDLYYIHEKSLQRGRQPLTLEKKHIRQLLTVSDNPKWNRIGEPLRGTNHKPLSKSWWLDSSPGMAKYKEMAVKNARSFFRGCHADAEHSLWSVPSLILNRGKYKVKGYVSSFCACNTRATNKFKSATSLAYLHDIYENASVKQWLSEQGAKVDEEMFALSMLVQWVWRSAIRDEKPIKLYLPSRRMRDILGEWLAAS